MGAVHIKGQFSGSLYPKEPDPVYPAQHCKDLCAADPKCIAFGTVPNQYFSNLENADGTTNTTCDIFIGHKNHGHLSLILSGRAE
jgi:hypothetical protein